MATRYRSRGRVEEEPFDPRNVVVLVRKSSTREIWAFYKDYKGRTYLHIRDVYKELEGGDWKPGKGLMVSIEHAPVVLQAIAGLAAMPVRAAA